MCEIFYEANIKIFHLGLATFSKPSSSSASTLKSGEVLSNWTYKKEYYILVSL